MQRGGLPGETMLKLVWREGEGLARKQVRHRIPRGRNSRDAGPEAQGRGGAGSSRD